MRFFKNSILKKTKEKRKRRDMLAFNTGAAFGALAMGLISSVLHKVCGKIKCRRCVKKMLAEKK